MKISVIIPAYNEEKNIAACLDAINKQTRKADEVIVVDNNSSDNTAKVAKEKGAKVVLEKKQGISWARRKGFNAAKGDLLARTDADSIPHPDWLEKIEKHFQKNKDVDALSGDIYFYDTAINTVWATRSYLQTLRMLLGKKTLIGANMTITKDIWEKIKGHTIDDNMQHEDLALSLDILLNGGKINFDTSVVVATSGRSIRDLKFYTTYQLKTIRGVILYHRKKGTIIPEFLENNFKRLQKTLKNNSLEDLLK